MYYIPEGGVEYVIHTRGGVEYVTDLDFVYMRNQHKLFVTYDSLL